MLNYNNVQQGLCALNNNCLGLNKGSTCYLVHVFLAVVVIFLSIHPQTRNVSWQSITLIAVSVALFLQIGFWNVNRQAQECAQPADKSIPWTDNSLFWYKDPFFLTLCVSSLLYGLCLFMPGTVACFDLEKFLPASSVGKLIVRVTAVLPTLGFIYYFIWHVAMKNQLVKPVRSKMHWWERPLAIMFSLVFIPFLLYTIFGDNLITGEGGFKVLRKFFTFRLWPAILLIAVLYVFVWRLQGGLFVSDKQYQKLNKAWKR